MAEMTPSERGFCDRLLSLESTRDLGERYQADMSNATDAEYRIALALKRATGLERPDFLPPLYIRMARTIIELGMQASLIDLLKETMP